MDDSIEYCREVESYLCKKNAGHLIRIVGPAFEQVKRWAAQGIPLKIVFRGIDRTCERHNAKPGRRRPLRIEFCEGDILSAFDDWRRATGTSELSEDVSTSRKEPLATHIERAVSRLLAVRTNARQDPLAQVIASTVAALDELVGRSREARGDERAALIAQLAELDTALIAAARGHLDPETAAALRREVDADLAPFASRMTTEARARASALAFDKLAREALGLPVLSYE
jgi:hypothetical protein